MPLLTAILNHGHTQSALALRRTLAPSGEVCLIDSGSTLSAGERGDFDHCLPNVYYGGLLNAAHDELLRRPHCTGLLFWASDVTAPDPIAVHSRATGALADPGIGLYAPASPGGSAHPQMRSHRRAGLRRVTFADGFCFAVRRPILDQVCPVDVALNFLGWGYDVALGYHARRARLACVVDDSFSVIHPRDRGYARAKARAQRDAWLRQQPRRLRWFYCISGLDPLKTPLGMRAVLALPW